MILEGVNLKAHTWADKQLEINFFEDVDLFTFFFVFSPVPGAPIEDEYNLQDHSDLYILDLGELVFFSSFTEIRLV